MIRSGYLLPLVFNIIHLLINLCHLIWILAMFNHRHATLLTVQRPDLCSQRPIPTRTSVRQAPPARNEWVRGTGGSSVTLQQRVLGFGIPAMLTVTSLLEAGSCPGEPGTCRALIGQPWPRPSPGWGGVSTRTRACSRSSRDPLGD